jgi:hypothetical protein
MKPSDVGFGRFFFRITACHMITYLVVGLLAYKVMDYPTQFKDECSIMIPTDSPRVALGPALQVIRGFIFALALYPFRRVFLDERLGWLKLWGLFLGLAILSTSGPAPGSVEGLIYTKAPIAGQIVGLWEVVLQTLAMSVLVVMWHRKPTQTWNIVMGILATLVLVMSIMGALLPRPEYFQ